MGPWDQHLRTGIQGLVLKSGDSFYPGINAAVEALDWLAQHSCVVLGFDGLDTDGTYIYPRLDYIADFGEIGGSWSERAEASITESRRVLADWTGEVQFVDLAVVEPDTAKSE